jgi:hypothetical protein
MVVKVKTTFHSKVEPRLEGSEGFWWFPLGVFQTSPSEQVVMFKKQRLAASDDLLRVGRWH